jgi:hypothetical protein
VASSVSITPYATTGFSGGFVVSTTGYIQGTFLDDPAMRYQLEGGIVASSQETPLWGGLPVTLAVPNVGVNEQGPTLVSATSLASIDGWTFFNQASAGVITPGSNVPLYPSGTSLNFARPGSLLRIALPVANSTILNDLAGAAPTVDLYWDPTNLCITTSSSETYGPLPVQLETLSATSETVTYSGGLANWNTSGYVAVVRI